jgi:hypothetical protein
VSDNWTKFKARVAQLLPKGESAMSKVAGATKTAFDAVRANTEQATDYLSDLYDRQLGEDEARILDQCPLMKSIRGSAEIMAFDPTVFGTLFNVRTRPLITAAILACGGGVAVTFDEELSRITRRLFDSENFVGGWIKDSLAGVLGRDTVNAVNRFIDTVPGSTVMGGGVLHRIQHGHDLASVHDIWQEHGFEGGVQAVYHILGRDFFTPAGIPILPTGSKEVHGFLTETLGIGKETAADLLSINFVEVLGSITSLVALWRLWKLARGVQENSRVRKLTERAADSAERLDFITATALLREALAIRPHDAHLTMMLASIYQRSGNLLQAHFAYRELVSITVADEPAIDLGGAAISLRGLAAAGALATSESLSRSDEYRGSWLEHILALSRAGVAAFENVAHGLSDRRIIKSMGETSVLPPRHLSAALNFYLAGRTAGAAMFLPEREESLRRCEMRLAEELDAVCGRASMKDRIGDLREVRSMTRAELGSQVLLTSPAQ